MNYAEQLAKIRANLALVEKCFEAHPALFEHATWTNLQCDPPTVQWWPWNGTLEQKQEVARQYADAGWIREVTAGSDKANWRATIDGVQFLLESAEQLVTPPGNGTRVEFPPVLQESQAA